MTALTHRRIASILGFLILGFFTFALYGAGLVEGLRGAPPVAIVFSIWLVGLAFETIREWRSAYSTESREQRYDFPTDLLIVISVFAGGLVTYWISVDLQQGAVVASALVGIFGAAFLKPYAVPIYCGSFVGMASSTVLGFPEVALAGAIAGVIFVLGKHVFNGFGGKLGTIAFAGCVGAAWITGNPLLSTPVLGWDVGWLLVVYSVAGAVVTFVLSVWFGHGPVMASGMIGLAGGLLLPALHGPVPGGLFAIGVFSASFAGMSGTNRFEKPVWMVPAGVLCALIIMYTTPYMGGAGGKLGTTAFGAVIGIRGLMVLGASLRRRLGFQVDDGEVPES